MQPPTSWAEIANIFELLSRLYRLDGKTALPPPGKAPLAEIDEACDVYCRRLASNMTAAEIPPHGICPWMLARAISVAALARELADNGESSPGPLAAPLIRRLLIDEWHGALRERWIQRHKHKLE